MSDAAGDPVAVDEAVGEGVAGAAADGEGVADGAAEGEAVGAAGPPHAATVKPTTLTAITAKRLCRGFMASVFSSDSIP